MSALREMVRVLKDPSVKREMKGLNDLEGMMSALRDQSVMKGPSAKIVRKEKSAKIVRREKSAKNVMILDLSALRDQSAKSVRKE